MIRPFIELAGLHRNQWRTPEALATIQFGKLQRMLDYSYRQVPFYRRLFDEAGFNPAALQDPDDLRQIPVTTRQTLQLKPLAEILSSAVDPTCCKKLTTAGSTGMPLTVYISPEDDRFKDMVWARTSLACGKRLTDRTVYFKFQSGPPYWFERLGIWRRVILSVLDPPEERVEAMRRARTQIVRANAFELLGVANAILEMGVTDIRPRAVFSMGSLLDEDARTKIERAFACDVYDCYGATELGCVAWECPEHSGLHINIDTTVVECLDGDQPAAPGQPGRLVCTALHSFAMPFIRYDIGDIGVLSDEPCPCGRGLPLMAHLECRADDFFISSYGRSISPSGVVNRIKRTPGIGQFRLTQKSPARIDAQVVPATSFSDASKDALVATLTDIMGPGLQLHITLVDEMPIDPGRKIRSMISEIKQHE
jgi:phenylacetate-CoA ligase